MELEPGWLYKQIEQVMAPIYAAARLSKRNDLDEDMKLVLNEYMRMVRNLGESEIPEWM